MSPNMNLESSPLMSTAFTLITDSFRSLKFLKFDKKKSNKEPGTKQQEKAHID